MKYIIDIPEDEVNISGILTATTMTPYDESEAEQRGREEAWEFAKKILGPSDNSDALTMEDLADCYGTDDAYDVVCGTTYQEAREKYEEWKKEKDDKQNREKVIALANDIGINCLYALVRDIRGEQ